MCPACIATAALVMAGATATGGLTALVVRRRRANPDTQIDDPRPHTGGPHDGSPESRDPN